MLIDLQVHSSAGSPDSRLDRARIGDLCREVQIDGVAITEHRPPGRDESSDVDEDILAVCGREVSFRGHHLLILFGIAEEARVLPAALDDSHPVFGRPDVAVIWAHPAAPGGSSAYAPFVGETGGVSGVVHAIEVLNGRHLHFPETVERAQELAARFRLPSTGGSDAHDAEGLGRCVTEVAAARRDGARGVIEALRRGDARPILNRRWADVRGSVYREGLEEYLK